MVYPPSSYRHTLDQEAFEALNHFPRFVGLCEAYIANVDEVAAKIDLLSTTIRISDKQFPKVYQLLPPICGQLDIGVPDEIKTAERMDRRKYRTIYLCDLSPCQ